MAFPSDSNKARAIDGLVIVGGAELDIRRQRCGKGFVYRAADGSRIVDADVVARIESLAIPPAYGDVRIASNADAHLQAVGRDAAGRWQHRYHHGWEAVRENRKARRLAILGGVLPRLRANVRRDLARRPLDRTKALACAVAIIDETHIRVGSEAYAESSGARGAATLLLRRLVCGSASRERAARCSGANSGMRAWSGR